MFMVDHAAARKPVDAVGDGCRVSVRFRRNVTPDFVGDSGGGDLGIRLSCHHRYAADDHRSYIPPTLSRFIISTDVIFR